MKRALATGLGAALLGGLIGGAAAYAHYLASTRPIPAATGTYTEGVVGRLGSLNPLFVEGDENARALASLIFEGLTRIEPGGEVGGALAQEWERNADEKTYRFTLRRGVRWADGHPLLADDALFTIRLVQDSAYQGTLFAGNWRGAQAEVEDPEHLRVTLPAPSAAFLANAAELPILPHHVFASASPAGIRNHPYNLQPFGTGPFRVAHRKGDLITLDRNPTARRAPFLERINIRSFNTDEDAAAALRRGDIDGLAEPPRVAALSLPAARVRLYSAETYRYASLLFNLKPDVSYFQDRRVRQAIGKAIDRPRLIRDALAKQASLSDGPIPPAISWAVNPQLRPLGYDVSDAQRLLDEAGWRELAPDAPRVNGSGQAFRISLVVGQEQAPLRTVAQYISDDLLKVGIEVEVVAVNPADLLRRFLRPRAFELALVTFDNGSDPDVFLFWHSSAAASGGFNFVSMRRNVFIDRDLEEGRATSDRALRQLAYFDFQRRLAEELPAVFLFSPRFIYAVNRRVKGIALDTTLEPSMRFRGVEHWYVDTRRRRT